MLEYQLGDIEQIPRGEGRNFIAGGIEIAIFRTRDDKVFATQPKCPHRQGPLADGLIGGETLICPLHELGFELATGAGIGHEECLTVYRTTLDSQGVIKITL